MRRDTGRERERERERERQREREREREGETEKERQRRQGSDATDAQCNLTRQPETELDSNWNPC